MLGGRGFFQLTGAVFGRHHYVALYNMSKVYPHFWDCLTRYLLARGTYPCKMDIHTPCGKVAPTLFSHDDMLTVNEIFCRQDYSCSPNTKVVVDLGSNIGISALYFLTRNTDLKCYLFEPVKANVEKLRQNLAGYEDRYVLFENAVSNVRGMLEFGIEPTGRYGGIGVETGESITVECLEINDVLKQILSNEERIGILKIDTEGAEESTLQSIQHEFLERIDHVYIESRPKAPIHNNVFKQRQYGSVCCFTNRNLAHSG